MPEAIKTARKETPKKQGFEPSPVTRVTDQAEKAAYISEWKKALVSKFGKGADSEVDKFANAELNSFFLYKRFDDGKVHYTHIIWHYDHKGGYNIRNLIPIAAEWHKTKDAKEIESISGVLAACYAEAEKFYGWDEARARHGIVVDGSSQRGGRAGTIYGMHIDFHYLFWDSSGNKKTITIERLRYWTSGMVHEMTHHERNDVNRIEWQKEVATSITEFLFDPKGNIIHARQTSRNLDELKRYREAGSPQRVPLQALSRDGMYEIAQYAALLIIADSMSESNKGFRLALIADSDPNKLGALAQIRDMITKVDIAHIKKTRFPDLMDPSKEPALMYDKVAKKLNTFRIEEGS